MNNYKQYTICLVNLGNEIIKGIQNGLRPAIILSNNIFNRLSSCVVIAPISSKINKQYKNPSHVMIGINEGLKTNSIILLEQIRIINKDSITKYIGNVINDNILKQIKKGMSIFFNQMPHIDGVSDKIFTLEKDQEIKKQIIDILKNIRAVERVISSSNNNNLISLLLGQRETLLGDLEALCDRNNINYQDYYIRFKMDDMAV